MSDDKVKEILREVIDNHTGENILDSGMVKDLKIEGNKVSFKFNPPAIGCAGCPAISIMVEQAVEKLNNNGYEVDVKMV